MKNMSLAALALIASMSAACAAEPEPASDESSNEQQQKGGEPSESAGVANPASVYCSRVGGTPEADTCTFADGTTCEQWSFYRGECGQAFSFCNQNGGQVSADKEDSGGFTISFALCTLPDSRSCKEQDFASTGKCE